MHGAGRVKYKINMIESSTIIFFFSYLQFEKSYACSYHEEKYFLDFSRLRLVNKIFPQKSNTFRPYFACFAKRNSNSLFLAFPLATGLKRNQSNLTLNFHVCIFNQMKTIKKYIQLYKPYKNYIIV